MIKVIAKALQFRTLLQATMALPFCAKKGLKKTADVTAMFTDRMLEEKKEKPITSGIFALRQEGRGKLQN